MLSIGIDVSKGKSTVCGMKPGGEIVYAPFEVQHTREGMSELVLLLHNSGEEVRAVLESTGSYHCPVVAALLENGIFVSVVNSLRMKRFCSQSIRKVKTDRIDANIEGEIENQQHDKQKRRNGCVATGENSVDLHGAGVLPTFMAFHHR